MDLNNLSPTDVATFFTIVTGVIAVFGVLITTANWLIRLVRNRRNRDDDPDKRDPGSGRIVLNIIIVVTSVSTAATVVLLAIRAALGKTGGIAVDYSLGFALIGGCLLATLALIGGAIFMIVALARRRPRPARITESPIAVPPSQE